MTWNACGLLLELANIYFERIEQVKMLILCKAFL